MQSIRLMDKKEDFEKLGLNQNKVEMWEDGRRNIDEPGHSEVWYFDAILEDGSKFVAGFRTSTLEKLNEKGDFPDFNIVVTTPEGETQQEFVSFKAEDCSFGKEKCDIHYGSNYVVGDFKNYDIHIENVNGLAADIHYKALVEPFRQATGYITLGNNNENYYTDLPVVNCEVTGTLTYKGKSVKVKGNGYHDHQWMNISPLQAFHHWLWGHLYTKDYTVYIYDFVGSEKYGFKRIPFFGIQDNKTGKTVFMTNGNVTLETKLELQEEMEKKFPKTSHYVFDNKDGNKCVFDITWKDEIELRNMYKNYPEHMRKGFDAMGVNPTYMRYYAHGKITLTVDGKTIASEGDMIYEYNYMGKEVDNAGV